MYRLGNLFDYYVYLTLKFEGENAAEFGNRAHERFLDSVESKIAELEEGISATVYNYLVLACAGEARHGSGMSDRCIPELNSKSYSRSAACDEIVDYEPQSSLERFEELFDRSWSSAYGGEAWRKMAEFAYEFGEGRIEKGFFIDHIVDLAHNGGFAFNKTEALRASGLYADLSHGRLVEFLNVKTFSRSLLRTDDLTGSMTKYMCKATARMVAKYYTLFRKGEEVPEVWERAQEEWPSFEPIQWGDDTLSELEVAHGHAYECYNCGTNLSEDDAQFDADGDAWCYDCFTAKHWKCKNCDRWFYHSKSSVEVDGHDWCEDCASDYAEHCDHCNTLTADNTYTVDGENWCYDCTYDDATECDKCGEYSQHTLKINGEDLCPSCMQSVVTCPLCGSLNHTDDMFLDEVSGQWVCNSGPCYETYIADPNQVYYLSPAKPAPGQLELGF